MADYTSTIAVQPFVIIPQLLRSCDAGFIISPVRMQSHESEIVKLVYDTYNREQVKSLYFVQIKSVLSKVLATTTLRSRVVDEKTGRQGLKLTFGISINPAYLRQTEVDFLFCFDAIAQCLCRVVSSQDLYSAAERILESFQKDEKASKEIVEHDAFDALLSEFQNRFWRTRRRKAFNFIHDYIPNAILFPELPRSQPLGDLDKVRRYWRNFGPLEEVRGGADPGLESIAVNDPFIAEILKSGLIQKLSRILDKFERDAERAQGNLKTLAAPFIPHRPDPLVDTKAQDSNALSATLPEVEHSNDNSPPPGM